MIAGEGADQRVGEAIELFASSGPLKSRIRGLVRIGERRWDVVLDRDQKILLPETDATVALRHVAALQERFHIFARDVSLVDFRNPQRMTVRSKSGDINVVRSNVMDASWGTNP